MNARSWMILTCLGAACAGSPAPTEPAPVAGTTNSVEASSVEAPEPRSSHHSLQLGPGPYVGASVEVRIDEVPTHGLRFFALQVNFADVAWAHGGLQRDPQDGHANWGGLVPGVDYEYSDEKRRVLQNIQNMPGRTSAAPWRTQTWYRYDIKRGALETLPPGEYAVLDEEPVPISESRKMWRWQFTITEVDTGEVVWDQHLFVAHPEITSATYWTETGYGITCEDTLTVHWRNPSLERDDGTRELPRVATKSLRQSTCPRTSTTDMAAVDHGGDWGTTQWYGVERAADSEHGDVLYEDSALSR